VFYKSQEIKEYNTQVGYHIPYFIKCLTYAKIRCNRCAKPPLYAGVRFLKIKFLMNFYKSLLIIYLSLPLGDTLLPFMNKALSIATFVTNIGPFTAQYIHDIMQITTIYSVF